MLLVLRVILLLGFASLLHATRKGKVVSMKLKQGIGSRVKSVRVCLDSSVLPDLSSLSASNMSLSPWIYRDTWVPSRLPRRISQAHCLTSGCLSPQEGWEDSTLEVRPIRYQILVLHRVPRQNQTKKGGKRKRKKYDFVLGTQVITVGCTCVRPTIVPLQ
ncbi:interleukin 17a/f3 [Odontesthes bonariensis]|uniref:interleukin 17a/f3 n=1 Tax=Odontesthes bonariensis TaxID=219752 RepID=UPI003F5820B6